MRTLLIVDDDKLVFYEIHSLLDWEAQGFDQILYAANGEQALACLKSQSVNLIITDIHMPVMNGIDLIANALAEYPSLIFLVLSNYDDFEYVKQALKLGAKDYILKYSITKDDVENFLKLYTRPQIPQPASVRPEIKRAIDFINRNLGSKLSLTSVSNEVGLSKNYFSNIFKQETGKGFVQYLNEIRVKEACRLLQDRNYSTYEIADIVGIKDYNYFFRIFKQYTGKNPYDFRHSGD